MDIYICLWNYDKYEVESCYYILVFMGYGIVEDMFFYFCLGIEGIFFKKVY